jgi:4-hydroxyphenylpyruvate dioxygenase
MIDIVSLHHIELYVANARHTAYYYCKALGFDLIAYGDNTTGLKDRVSFILKQGHAHVILTSTVNNSDFIQKHVINHGDGVRDICFFVNEIEKTYSNLVNLSYG